MELSTLPAAPGFLSERAREVWADVGGRLIEGRGLSADDLPPLGAYAAAVARIESCEAFLAKEGCVLTMRDAKGQVRDIIEAPELSILTRERAAVLKLGDALGISQRARERKAVRAFPAEGGDFGGEE